MPPQPAPRPGLRTYASRSPACPPAAADLRLFGEPADYSAIVAEIEGVPGVVAHGLMANVAAAAVVAHPDGPRLVWRGTAKDADAETAEAEA